MSSQSYPRLRTPQLAEYVLTESLENAPDDVDSDLRRRVVDTLAAIVAGYRVEGGSVAAEYACETFAGDEATVLDGSDRRLGTAGATYANAMAANALDVDDGHRIAEGHPSAVLVPAALAVAEARDVTVDEFLDALLVGYEIAVRAAVVLHERTGMHTSTGSWGAVGAAAAVARLLDLDRDTTADALGIAEFNAPLSPVMRSVARPASSMTKDGIGWGSYLGTSAPALAARGFGGSGTVFDEIEWQGLEEVDLPPLGDEYLVTEGYYKPYPACRWIHSGIDATLELRETHEIDVSEIETVHVHSHRKAIGLATPRPETPDAAQYSYPYMLAVTLLEDDWLTPEQLTGTWRRDERVHELVDRVRLHLDDEADRRYPEQSTSRIEIVTTDDSYESELTHPRGARERPMSDDEHRTKQELYIDPHVGTGAAERVRSVVTDDDAPVRALLEPFRNAGESN